jgi:hypothetical protein
MIAPSFFPIEFLDSDDSVLHTFDIAADTPTLSFWLKGLTMRMPSEDLPEQFERAFTHRDSHRTGLYDGCDQDVDGYKFNGKPTVVALRWLENLRRLQSLDLSDIESIDTIDWLNFSAMPLLKPDQVRFQKPSPPPRRRSSDRWPCLLL